MKTERVMMMTKSNRGYFSNQVDVTLWSMMQSRGHNSKINDLILASFEIIRYFSRVPLICNVQEDQTWKSYADDKHFPIVSL